MSIISHVLDILWFLTPRNFIITLFFNQRSKKFLTSAFRAHTLPGAREFREEQIMNKVFLLWNLVDRVYYIRKQTYPQNYLFKTSQLQSFPGGMGRSGQWPAEQHA